MFCQMLEIIYAFESHPEHFCNTVNRKYIATENTSLKKEKGYQELPDMQ